MTNLIEHMFNVVPFARETVGPAGSTAGKQGITWDVFAKSLGAMYHTSPSGPVKWNHLNELDVAHSLVHNLSVLWAHMRSFGTE